MNIGQRHRELMFWKLDVYLDVFVLHCTAVEMYFRANTLAYELLQVQENLVRAHQHGPC